MRPGTIAQVTSKPAEGQHLRDLARLRRVRDRIDREYAQPLDVEALARGAHMSAGHLSRRLELAFGESPYSYLMTRRVQEPTGQPYGVRDCAVRDPAGNLIRIQKLG